MKASVIIPTKNPGVIFRSVLNAVLGQSADFPYEVLVIDSGSQDGTLEYLANVLDSRLRVHQIPPASFGHGRTRNLGVSMTSGEYAVLVTHDAMPANERWLAELVAVADSDPGIAGVFGRHIAYESADPFTKNELETHFRGFDSFQVVHLDDRARYVSDPGYKQVLHFFSDNNALVRRSVWNIIPYPDVDFAEDQLWAREIIEAGYKKAYARDAIVYHSHNYSLIERMQRSFDEAYAFKRLFGYILCRSLREFARSWLGITRRDIIFVRSARLYRAAPMAVVKMPFDNFMRLLGHFLGSHGERLSKSWRLRLSWDRRLADKI